MTLSTYARSSDLKSHNNPRWLDSPIADISGSPFASASSPRSEWMPAQFEPILDAQFLFSKLRQNLGDDLLLFHARQAGVEALEFHAKPFVVDSAQMQDGGVQVVQMNGV